MSEPTANSESDLGFDQVLENLRAAVHQLETGKASLEDSLRIYEDGVRMARRGHALLDRAEERVELLVREGRDGPTAVPLDDTSNGPARDDSR